MIGALLIGLAGGLLAGLMGVGGGILFVPGLALFLGLSQVDAEATSLVAIVPVALAGAWRQIGYGNVRIADAAVIGALSLAGAIAGATLADELPERALEICFAALLLTIAASLVRRTLAGGSTRAGQSHPRGERPRDRPPEG